MTIVRKGIAIIACLILCGSVALAQDSGAKPDPFKGKLFPPDLILKNQAELNLSKGQLTELKAAVVQARSNMAEHEWDLGQAYQRVMTALEQKPIDEDRVIKYINDLLLAENEVKKQQVLMLIRLKNLLNENQVAYLESLRQDD